MNDKGNIVPGFIMAPRTPGRIITYYAASILNPRAKLVMNGHVINHPVPR